MEKEWIYRIALKMTPGLGDVTLRRLLDHYGSAEALFRESPPALRLIKGLTHKVIEEILSNGYLPAAEAQYRQLCKLGATFLSPWDRDYPVRLAHCPDAPFMLFYKGSSLLNGRRVLGVVGTRKATEAGRHITEKIVKGMAGYGVTIVSGLAYGIDTQAHRAALSVGLPTIAVLGHGLDIIYPKQNMALARKMVEQGGLVTEFFVDTVPDRENFPKRNRIIAGLCDAIVVVEAAAKGGALITAEIAHSYSRDVFAVPGRWSDDYSEGCNHLIKVNKAALIQSAEDVLYMMGWKTPVAAKQTHPSLFVEMSEKEQMIYRVLLKQGASGIDYLSHLTKIGSSELSSLLLKMEFDGIIRVLPGKLFELS
ncbi:MAG: DNA-protecting protein DprA [Bacteroidetes bacterium]|nr:MAG: DNA-protecting protein DprA [Bacteroidota bacterium]PIE87577.1 MAG: DNA-protecting protein DprA [Bacteroidota bacterium]